MPVFDIFSYRKMATERKLPDVFEYDTLPDTLRVQILRIMQDAIGGSHHYTGYAVHRARENNEGWEFIHDVVAREHGVPQLAEHATMGQRCEDFLLSCSSVAHTLDLVEVSFSYVDKTARRFQQFDRLKRGIKVTASDAIAELNTRFRRAGVGYQFESGMIVRVDSELIHSEMVVPALRFLCEPGFDGPRDEFVSAHKHYRAGDTKDAVTDANNAFESTLKTICDQRGWSYPTGGRASDLLKAVRENGLLPPYLDRSFEQLAATLRSGLPKVRNAEGAHGQGAVPREAPDYVAAYALHLAAANIVFLAAAHKATTSNTP